MVQRWQARALCVIAWAVSGAAQAHDIISTDRPDVVESSDVVGKGRFQIETSYAVEREAKDQPRSRTHATPTLLRIGLGETTELRLETDGLMRVNTWEGGQQSTQRGTADTAVGLKWHVRTPPEGEAGPSMAWLFHFDLPSGTPPFRSQGIRPSARLVGEWDLGGVSMGLMPGLYVDHNDDNKRYVGGIFAATVSTSLADRLRGFVEFAGQQLTGRKNGGNVVTLDGGLAYLITDEVQVDVAGAKGLSKATPRQQWTVGLSIRY